MANTNTRGATSKKALGDIARSIIDADPWPIPARGGGQMGRPLLAGEKDRQSIGRTVDKLAGPPDEVAQSLPIPSAMGQLEQATGFLEQVLETLECRLGTVLTATDSAIGGAVAESTLDECALSGSIARQARRVSGSSERLLDILNRLAL